MAWRRVGNRLPLEEGKSLAFYWGLRVEVAAAGLITGVSLGGPNILFGDQLPAWVGGPRVGLLGAEALSLMIVMFAGFAARPRSTPVGPRLTSARREARRGLRQPEGV